LDKKKTKVSLWPRTSTISKPWQSDWTPDLPKVRTFSVLPFGVVAVTHESQGGKSDFFFSCPGLASQPGFGGLMELSYDVYLFTARAAGFLHG